MRHRQAVLVFGLLAAISQANLLADDAKSKANGETILTDASLFPAGFGANLIAVRYQLAAKAAAAPGGTVGEFATSVPDGQQPALEAITAKYGAAERTETRQPGKRKGGGLVGPPREVVIHWYAKVGFGVPKVDDATDDGARGKVIWVVLAPKK